MQRDFALSTDEIVAETNAEILGISRNTVAKVLNTSKAVGLKWENIRLLTERELEEKLFPKKTKKVFK